MLCFSGNIINFSVFDELSVRLMVRKGYPVFYVLHVGIKYPDAVTRMRVPDSLPTLSFEKRAISRGKIFIPKTYTEDSSVPVPYLL